MRCCSQLIVQEYAPLISSKSPILQSLLGSKSRTWHASLSKLLHLRQCSLNTESLLPRSRFETTQMSLLSSHGAARAVGVLDARRRHKGRKLASKNLVSKILVPRPRTPFRESKKEGQTVPSPLATRYPSSGSSVDLSAVARNTSPKSGHLPASCQMLLDSFSAARTP